LYWLRMAISQVSSLRIFPLLIPEMSTNFMSLIVQIIPIYFNWIL
jgi:hypothetical protein